MRIEKHQSEYANGDVRIRYTWDDADAPQCDVTVSSRAGTNGITESVAAGGYGNIGLSKLPVPVLERLVGVWADRSEALAQYTDVAYVAIRECLPGMGEAGQAHAVLLAGSSIPDSIIELVNEGDERGGCMSCRSVHEVVRNAIIGENHGFLAVAQGSEDEPTGVVVYMRKHKTGIVDFCPNGRHFMAEIIHSVYRWLDDHAREPYRLEIRQRPVGELECPRYHFHLVFTPASKTT